MRRVLNKQTLKLQLLALVLALAIIWYSLNPAPISITHSKRKDVPPDEKKRNVEAQSMPATWSLALMPSGESFKPLPPPSEDEDEFEWPEFIDG
jgi:hypothetical protein